MSKTKTIVKPVKSTKEKVLAKLKEKLTKSYIPEPEYGRTSCTGECRANDDYCRCTKIINPKIEELNANPVISDILELFPKDIILRYCVDRILRGLGIGNKENWDVHICGGYYGEEIDGCEFSNTNKVLEKISELLDLSDNDKIYYALKFEYGYILPSVENKNWIVQEVLLSEIYIPQEDHYRRLDRETIESYEGITLPIGICVKDTQEVKLVDGYHRYAAAKNAKMEKVQIIRGV